MRGPSLAPAADGWFHTFVQQPPASDRYHTFAGPIDEALAPTGDRHDAGFVTSPTRFVHATLTAGDDGRYAACATFTFDAELEPIPGGVAFYRPSGELERVVRFDWDCAAVAFVGGRWAAIEVSATVDVGRARRLMIFDTAAATVERTVELGIGDENYWAENVVALDGRALVTVPQRRGGLIEALVIDVSDGAIEQRALLPLSPNVFDGTPRYDIAAAGPHAVVVAAAGPSLDWLTLDVSLSVVSRGPSISLPLRPASIDVEPLPGGWVVAWALTTAAPGRSALMLALLGGTDSVTRIDPELPMPIAGELTDWLDLATRGNRIAIALSPNYDMRIRAGFFGAECVIR